MWQQVIFCSTNGIAEACLGKSLPIIFLIIFTLLLQAIGIDGRNPVTYCYNFNLATFSIWFHGQLSCLLYVHVATIIWLGLSPQTMDLLSSYILWLLAVYLEFNMGIFRVLEIKCG